MGPPPTPAPNEDGGVQRGLCVSPQPDPGPGAPGTKPRPGSSDCWCSPPGPRSFSTHSAGDPAPGSGDRTGDRAARSPGLPVRCGWSPSATVLADSLSHCEMTIFPLDAASLSIWRVSCVTHPISCGWNPTQCNQPSGGHLCFIVRHCPGCLGVHPPPWSLSPAAGCHGGQPASSFAVRLRRQRPRTPSWRRGWKWAGGLCGQEMGQGTVGPCMPEALGTAPMHGWTVGGHSVSSLRPPVCRTPTWDEPKAGDPHRSVEIPRGLRAW